MATLRTAAITAQILALTNGAGKADSNETGRELLIARVRYPLTGAEAAADVLEVMKLPAGAVVIPELCSVVCDDPGTVLTGTLGFKDATETADVDAYSSLLTLDAGGIVRAVPTVRDTIEHATGATVQFVIGTATTVTAAADVWFSIVYSRKR